MTSLSTVHANNLLDASLGTASLTATTAPLKCRLMSTNGTATTNGTEVTGGSYASQTVTFAAAASQSAASNVVLTYTLMPAITVNGVELWDSAGTPVRKHWGALATPKTTNAGDTFSIASGSLTVAFT